MTFRKYHNKKVIIDGKKFDSQKEGNYYLKLKMLEKAIMQKHCYKYGGWGCE